MKILLLDCETAPNLVHVWGLWQQNVGLPQIIASGYVMCWSAKFLGEKEMFFDSIFQSSKKKMMKGIYKLVDEADVVVHFNGTKFDMPTLNKEFLLLGMSPPSPYKQVDLLQTARRQFRFPSNKLDYLAKELKIGTKTKHAGHELWIQCMAGDKDAWLEMEKYNKNDVVLLENLYYKLLPWIKGHPNVALYKAKSENSCPRCGGKHYQSRGYIYTTTCRYNRFRCSDCGTWFRDRKNNLDTERFANV